MSRGIRVFFIQKGYSPDAMKTKIIPLPGERVSRYINPCSRVSSFAAISTSTGNPSGRMTLGMEADAGADADVDADVDVDVDVDATTGAGLVRHDVIVASATTNTPLARRQTTSRNPPRSIWSDPGFTD